MVANRKRIMYEEDIAQELILDSDLDAHVRRQNFAP
jgi:hypothetical protein